MAEEMKLVKPWMVAVWPGIGQVAISAGYYLMSKLGMHALAEFSPRKIFDVDHVEVKDRLSTSDRLLRLIGKKTPRPVHLASVGTIRRSLFFP